MLFCFGSVLLLFDISSSNVYNLYMRMCNYMCMCNYYFVRLKYRGGPFLGERATPTVNREFSFVICLCVILIIIHFGFNDKI